MNTLLTPTARDLKSALGIRLDHVSHGYGKGELYKPVIDDCSLDFEVGKVTVIVGPSGCGKSTLIGLIAGFERPTRGKVLAEGLPVKGPSPERLVVFQETALFSWMSNRNNVLFGPAVRGDASPSMLRRASALLDTVGLSSFAEKYPTQLSGGMQRRAELARALINEPKVMLLDEPFRGLDSMTKTLMQEHFLRLVESTGQTCIFVTSDIDEAVLLADRLLVMTNRPCRVAAEFEVKLDRPRSIKQLVGSDHANEVKFNALEVLHAEAMKSFATGSKTASDFLAAYAARKETSGAAERPT